MTQPDGDLTDKIAEAIWQNIDGDNDMGYVNSWTGTIDVRDVDMKRVAEAVVSVVTAHTTVDTVEALDALPDDTVIRAEEVRRFASGRPHVIAKYFEKWGGDQWIDMDPADRNDGEDHVPSDLIIRYYAKGGRCIVLFRPDGGES